MSSSPLIIIDLDGDPVSISQQSLKKVRKRKRLCSTPIPWILDLTLEQRETQMKSLQLEIEGLFSYYKEMAGQKVGFGLGLDLSGHECHTVDGFVGLLMEESELPLSRLVDDISCKLVDMRVHEGVCVSSAMVKAAIVSVGQRMMYGISNADADVLEDDTQACLWCWETRDVRIIPKCLHGILKVRRTCRAKIRERIIAISAMMAAIQKPEIDQNCNKDQIKASKRLSKVLGEADIRLLVNSLLQKISTEIDTKEAKRQEKLLIKQLEKSKELMEREKMKICSELAKEKLQNEKEENTLADEIVKDECLCEKEADTPKLLRKQQKGAEKERRDEKEKTELKKRNAIQKQASLMERFLKRNKSSSVNPNGFASADRPSSASATELMDCTLVSNSSILIGDILKSHLTSWHCLGHSLRSNKTKHWSIRQKPKTELFTELKLTSTREQLVHDVESSVDSTVNWWRDQISRNTSGFTNLDSSNSKKHIMRKKLLQFDENNRPAFYGFWPKKSLVVGPQHPFKKEPDLDYEVDSDEEWEEEDPGESLSDCDKDDDEVVAGGCPKDDEVDDESDDGFFVPDGYLSENEGVQLDPLETDLPDGARRVSSSLVSEQQDGDSHGQELCTLAKYQKHLNNLTEAALRKNQPFVILNLPSPENQRCSSDLEKTCLQALAMRAYPIGPPIDISLENTPSEEHVARHASNATSASSSSLAVLDSYMPVVVNTIQSCPRSISKVVESLQQKFPTVSKSRLKSKVREVSDFVDNHWQVKKQILDQVGTLH